MKINRILSMVLLLLALPAAGNLESKILIRDKVILDVEAEEEIFAIANEISISGNIQNEFFGIAKKISTLTEIKGDYIGIALDIFFSGLAEKDMYLVGNNMELSGKVGGSLNALGRTLHINADINGNIRAAAENISIRGDVGGKTTLWGRDITIRGTFDELTLYADSVKFLPGTVVKGDLTYFTPEDLDLRPVSLEGESQWNRPVSERILERGYAYRIRKFYPFFSLLFPILITFWIFPNLLKNTARTSFSKFPHCYVIGLLWIIAATIILPLMFITIIGAPLGLITASIFISSAYISRVLPAIFIGRKILFKMPETRGTWVLAISTGVLLFTLISIHPTARLLLNIICIPAGLGAIVNARIKLLKRLREEEIL